MDQEYDAVIIGGGHNGLVCASYLGKAGLKVLLLERRHLVGGAAVSENLWPGFKANPFANLCSFFQRKVTDDLELRKFGLDFHVIDPQMFHPFADGRSLFIWRDGEKTLNEIEQFSIKDAKAYLNLDRDLLRLAQLCNIPILGPPPTLGQIMERLTNPEDQALFTKVITCSYTDFLSERFESEEVISALAHNGLGSMIPGGPSTPGTMMGLFYSYIHRSGLAHGMHSSSAMFKGGTGVVSEALVKAAEVNGVTVRTNVEVSRVEITNGISQGIKLVGGEVIKSTIVISNADPSRTFSSLVGKRHLDDDFNTKFENYRYGIGFFSLVLALDGLPNFTASPGDERPGPSHTGLINIAPSISYMDRAWRDAKEGHTPEYPFLNGTIYSAVFPEMAPPGKHVMTMWARTVPYKLENAKWCDEKERFGQRCIDILNEYAPNIRDRILHYRFYDPEDLEDTLYLTGGHIHHGDLSFDQMLSNRPFAGWSEYRTPIKNMYLCGAGTHPGGGVSGAPGHNAAHQILKDWGEGVVG